MSMWRVGRHFFGGDSYILLYSYTKPGSRSEEHIIYFWLGNDSSADEKGAAALLTVKLDGTCLSAFSLPTILFVSTPGLMCVT
jgi:hypothetical protein